MKTYPKPGDIRISSGPACLTVETYSGGYWRTIEGMTVDRIAPENDCTMTAHFVMTGPFALTFASDDAEPTPQPAALPKHPAGPFPIARHRSDLVAAAQAAQTERFDEGVASRDRGRASSRSQPSQSTARRRGNAAS